MKTLIKIVSVTAVLLLAGACGNPVTGSQKQYGSLELSFDGLTRTVFPNTAAIEVKKYVISFSGGPENRADVTFDSNDAVDNRNTVKSITVLAVGTWNVTVKAYLHTGGSSEVFASLMKTVDIAANEVTTVSFVLPLHQSGNGIGNVDITVNWSEANLDSRKGINHIMSSSLTSLNGSGTVVQNPDGLVLDKDASTLTYNTTLASGHYLLNVMLGNSDSNTNYVPYVRVIQVYDYLTSAQTVKFQPEHFTARPAAPAKPTGAEAKKGIEITWNNDLGNAAEFIIERQITDSNSWSDLPERVLGTNTFIDITAESDVSYDYRVRAAGLKGDSEPSEPVTGLSWSLPVPGGEGFIDFQKPKTAGVGLSWSQANDTGSSPDDLEYKVVWSTVSYEDVADVAFSDIDNNVITGGVITKKIVRDWSSLPASMPWDLTGLTPGKQYYVDVLVRDRAGNVASYNKASQDKVKNNKDGFITNSVGSLEVTIDYDKPVQPVITFTDGNGAALSGPCRMNETVTLSVKESFKSYRWYVNGALQASTAQTLDILLAEPDFSAGAVCSVTVVVTADDNRPYSGYFSFLIEQ